MDWMKKYNKWLENENIDEETKAELRSIKNDKDEIEERFYTDLAFGTAGLRGKMGAGTNRMNKYVIALTTKALAEVIKDEGEEAKKRGVAIAYDVRNKSDEFAKTAALVLAENGVKAYLFDDIRPTPELSYAVRKFNTQSGIVVTASHNPKEYNGYKVYWEEGSQILSDIAERVTEKLSEIDDIASIKKMDEKEAKEKGLLQIIGKDVDDEYIAKVKGTSIRDLKEDTKKDIRIVYTPLNGTGYVPVTRVLDECGYENVYVVEEQAKPDPTFATVGYPNPEDTKAFKYAIELGKEKDADILIATDPDCDRMAVMVKDNSDEYVSMNGNQTGAVFIKYILEGLKAKGELPSDGVVVKSIVTGDLGKSIAESMGVESLNALTGFKNICAKANEYEKTGEKTFIFGYEESIGYVYDTFVRDKDAVIASLLIAEAAAYYKENGKNLLEILDEIYKEHGYFSEDLFSLVLEGIEGQERIARMMNVYEDEYLKEIEGAKLVNITDYQNSIRKDLLNNKESKIEMDKTNALKYEMDNDSWYAIRPSGTEPKIKIYIYAKGEDKKDADKKVENIRENVLNKLNSIE